MMENILETVNNVSIVPTVSLTRSRQLLHWSSLWSLEISVGDTA